MADSYDQQFNHYYQSKIRRTKATCDLLCFIGIALFANILSEFYFTLDTCNSAKAELLRSPTSHYGPISDYRNQNQICLIDTNFKSWAAAWLIYTLVRIPFLMRQSGPLLKWNGLYLTRLDGEEWRLTNTLFYGFIEWLPFLFGAAYLLFFHIPTALFGVHVHATIFGGAQLIWLAPVLFRFNNRNLAEIVTGVTVETTGKRYRQIEKSYSRNLRRRLDKVSVGLDYTVYILTIGLFAFSFIQILRVPEQNPAYQKTIYGGYEPVWQNNIYFAMEGISAPAHVSDFYQYGLKKAYERFKHFEDMKELSEIDEEYRYDIPKFANFSVTLEKERELKIKDGEWKNLECLYELDVQQNDECATFSDWQKYTEQNKTMWGRFNQAPDLGKVYMTPPQFVGSDINNIIPLAELKAVHIIYLAKNGETNKAMSEWLKYMDLYRAMAETRETMIFKAKLALNIKKHLAVLERLLNIAPELASAYKQDLLLALRNDGPIFRDPYIMSDYWGLLEAPFYAAMGNVNALQNDILKCVRGFRTLAKKPHDEHPYTDEKIVLCSLHKSESTFKRAIVDPVITSGAYSANAVHGLLFRGVPLGKELLDGMKVTQVRFRQAQLGVKILSQGIPAYEVGHFVENVPGKFQNPIANKPFEWDDEGQFLYFRVPGEKRQHKFHLNIEK